MTTPTIAAMDPMKLISVSNKGKGLSLKYIWTEGRGGARCV